MSEAPNKDDKAADVDQNVDDGQDANLQALEEEASRDGWVPKDQFHGAESDWVDAATFVERGKAINPILRKNNERLMKEINQQKAEIAELRLTTKEFGDEFRKMTDNAYKRAVADVKQQIKDARRDGNEDLAADLEEQRDDLIEQSKDVKVPGSSDQDKEKARQNAESQAVLDTWIGENPWYNEQTNPALFYAAEGIALRFSRTDEGKRLIGTRPFLDKVKELTQKANPEGFKNPRRKDGSPVGSSNSTSTQSRVGGKKGYNDLPPDAKAACDRQVKNIPGFTKDKYVQFYFEQEGV